jgi:hypothetical protein
MDDKTVRKDLESTVLEAIMPRDYNAVVNQQISNPGCSYLECEKRAEFIVHHDCDDMYCITEACSEHLAELIGCTAEEPQEFTNYHLLRIPQDGVEL